jgi:hypothetical protein
MTELIRETYVSIRAYFIQFMSPNPTRRRPEEAAGTGAGGAGGVGNTDTQSPLAKWPALHCGILANVVMAAVRPLHTDTQSPLAKWPALQLRHSSQRGHGGGTSPTHRHAEPSRQVARTALRHSSQRGHGGGT